MAMTRRQALARGLAGTSILAVGGVGWRAWDNGAFSVGAGPAYEPWHQWRGGEGPLALVRAGILAANAHNTQPWRFHIANDTIAVLPDPERHLGAFDPFRREMHLSLGCALENLAQAAPAHGLEARIELIPGQLTLAQSGQQVVPVATVRLVPAEKAPGELYAAIPQRHTHRGAYLVGRTVPEQLLREMQSLLPDAPNLRLSLFPARDKRPLGELIVAATKSIISDRQMAADSARWFRLTWDAVQRHRDGITLDAVGLPPLVNAAAKILPAPSDQQADLQWLDATANVHVATAPLLGMIAVRDLYDRPTALAAGQFWQRLHLWLTARGLVAQPLNQPAEMVDRERQRNASPQTAQGLARLTDDPAWHPTFIFRAGYADHPARLSPRRPVEAVVTT